MKIRQMENKTLLETELFAPALTGVTETKTSKKESVKTLSPLLLLLPLNLPLLSPFLPCASSLPSGVS